VGRLEAQVLPGSYRGSYRMEWRTGIRLPARRRTPERLCHKDHGGKSQ